MLTGIIVESLLANNIVINLCMHACIIIHTMSYSISISYRLRAFFTVWRAREINCVSNNKSRMGKWNCAYSISGTDVQSCGYK